LAKIFVYYEHIDAGISIVLKNKVTK
jgi:hypothetical protein